MLGRVFASCLTLRAVSASYMLLERGTTTSYPAIGGPPRMNLDSFRQTLVSGLTMDNELPCFIGGAGLLAVNPAAGVRL